MINDLKGQDKILKLSYTVLQIKKGLSKAWIGYTIAKKKGEHGKLKYYAPGIQKLERELIDAGIASPQSLNISKYRYRWVRDNDFQLISACR